MYSTDCLQRMLLIMRNFEQPVAWAIAAATWLRLCCKLMLIICAQVGTGHSGIHEDQHGHLVYLKMQEVLGADSETKGRTWLRSSKVGQHDTSNRSSKFDFWVGLQSKTGQHDSGNRSSKFDF